MEMRIGVLGTMIIAAAELLPSCGTRSGLEVEADGSVRDTAVSDSGVCNNSFVSSPFPFCDLTTSPNPSGGYQLSWRTRGSRNVELTCNGMLMSNCLEGMTTVSTGECTLRAVDPTTDSICQRTIILR